MEVLGTGVVDVVYGVAQIRQVAFDRGDTVVQVGDVSIGLGQLREVHRITRCHTVRHVSDGGAARVGAVIVGVTAQRHAVVVHRTVNKGVVLNRTIAEIVGYLCYR